MSAIVLEGLKKNYGAVVALDGLDFRVERGVVFGFLGPNGAGKTTTLRILAGVARPSGGRAEIEGKSVGPESPARAAVGYLPEEPGFYPWLTAREFLVDLIGGLYGMPPRKAKTRGAEMLELVGLEEVADRRVGGFSRGMRQRLGLAQALMNQPRVLLMDEPVSALDPAGRHDILALIDSLRGEATVLMSSHILADVERICDTIGIIDRGKLIALGDRGDLLRRHAVPITEVVFDAPESAVKKWSDSIRELRFIRDVQVTGKVVRITLEAAGDADLKLQNRALGSNLIVQSYQQVRPQLEDVFLSLVG